MTVSHHSALQRQILGTNPEGVTSPSIDDLLEKVDSKYRLMISAAKRAQQINVYYSRLGEGLLENVGPLVSVVLQEKPLSAALHELQDGFLQCTQIDPEAETAERTAVEADPVFTFVGPSVEPDANPPS